MLPAFGLAFCVALAVSSCRTGSEVVYAGGGRVAMDSLWDVAPDADAAALLAAYKVKKDCVMGAVVGKSARAMESGRPESLLSNFVADVLREASVRVGKKADIGLCNIGGLRSTMPQGQVTYGDVLEIAPFENRLCMVALTGGKLMELMQQVAAVGGEGISGAHLVITADGRLLNAEVGGMPIKADSIYVVATLDYLAEGNDRMYAFKDGLSKNETPLMVRDLIMEAIRRAKAQGRKVTARMEGRIVVQ